MSTETATETTPEAVLGVGIVGLSAAGGWAAGAHVPALTELPGFELRGLVASTPASAAAAGAKFGVEYAVNDIADLVANDGIDIVVITVKVPEHQQLVRSALDAGKAVLCEWPLGNGLAEAIAMAEAAESRAVRAFVGLQARSAPAIRYLRVHQDPRGSDPRNTFRADLRRRRPAAPVPGECGPQRPRRVICCTPDVVRDTLKTDN